MEATAVSVGKSVLNGALGYAKSALAEEVALQLGIQKDHAFVADELEMMRSFMMEGHEERDDSKVVNTWVKQVRDTAYDVEDSLQDFAVRLHRPSRWRFLCTLIERRRVAKQMKELRAKVEDVSQRNKRYRLIKGTTGSKATTNAAEQSSLIANAIFGIDDARRATKQDDQRVDLVQLISEDGDDDLKVIVVWGTSGDIGQTTIIRAAYDNLDVQSKFEGRAWVRVMHPFCPKGFVQSLVSQFLAAEGVKSLLDTEKTAQELAQEFDGYVNNKRFLLVLTDLCTIEEWDQIRKCFPKSNKGSRIVLSTTQVEVASLCAGPESQPTELKKLCADQTLYVFYDKGSRNGKDSVKPTCSSYAAISSTNDDAVAAQGEIIEDQSKDADEKEVVTKSLTRTRTGVGASEESQLIGREKEIIKVIDLISNKNSQKVQVIAVWGMGGLGKTTLINGVYYSPKLSDKFEKRVFVTIMRPFDPAQNLRSLIEGLDQGPSTKEELLENSFSNKRKSLLASMGVEGLTMELANLLETKSCLIVLDDLSSTTEWDLIIPKFPQMKTSRIIVTTREEKIANHCTGSENHGTIHNLKVLDPKDAFHLFSKKVYGEARDLVDQKNNELVKEAELILKKCGGLPLAIVVIGGFLANRPKTLEEWRKLNENINAELEMNPELGMIRTVLQKSYDGLPYYLKSCFLYLSIFPEDMSISRKRLVQRWAAEGYSTEEHGKSAIEIADGYFMELKNRSMILPSQSVCSRKSIDSCNIHDLIRDIAISKAAEENLVFRLEEGCSLNTHSTIRHIAISNNWNGDSNEFGSLMDMSRIRSLSLFGEWKNFFISDKMRLVRVLDLEGTNGLKYHHLDHIWKLIHLKYLSLRGCGGIDLLPDSLGNLRQLQVLDIKGTCVIALPKTIIKLRKIQHIHAGNKSRFAAGKKSSLMKRCVCGACQCASCCVPILVGIDGPFHKALTRRDACAYACCVRFPSLVMGLDREGGATVPKGIRKLKGLHTLGEVNVGRGNAVLQDIKILSGLRKLGVAGINKKNGMALCSAISNLSKLESLSVRSEAGKSGLRGCLDISSPPKSLQSLKLYGNLETLPEWIGQLQHLVKLTLGSTRLLAHVAVMELLGKLPKLEILRMYRWQPFEREELEFQSQQQAGTTTFGSLRGLYIYMVHEGGGMIKVRSVKFEDGTMPKLEWLRITAHKVNNEFGLSGLQFLPSINQVQLLVDFSWDKDKTSDENRQEERRRKDELKKEIQVQLSRNTNEPIVTVELMD